MRKAILLILLLVLGGCKPTGTDTDVSKVTMGLYVMAQCPYGVQVEDALGEVVDKLGNSFAVEVSFIGSGTATSLGSLHGENEVKADIAQLCANRYNPDKSFKLILCMNKDAGNMPGNWESCAKDLKMDVEKIKACFDGDEGRKLAEDSFKKSETAGAQGSPTIYLAGKSYTGRRDSKSLLAGVCNAYGDKKPSACNDIPKPVEFDITIVNDAKCTTCDGSMIKAALGQMFEGAKFKDVDIATDEGKKLVADFKLEKAPSILFSGKVDTTDEWKTNDRLQTAFDKVGTDYRMKDEVSGASYFLDPARQAAYEKEQQEAKQKAIDMLGVKKNDNKPQIDFFVMSYCPYGNQAEEGIKPVYDNLKGKADFNPRYVIYSNYNGGGDDFCMGSGQYCSMHGIQELHQDVRELCVDKYMGVGPWFDFAIAMNSKCNYQDADTCWEGVAKELKLDTQKIKTCEKNEALALLKAEQDLGNLLGVQGSPTIFVEGASYEGDRSPNGYQTAICDAFDKKPSECGKTLAGTQNTQAPAAGGCGAAQ